MAQISVTWPYHPLDHYFQNKCHLQEQSICKLVTLIYQPLCDVFVHGCSLWCQKAPGLSLFLYLLISQRTGPGRSAMRTHWIGKWGEMNGQETKFLPSVFSQSVATPSLPVLLISCSIIRKKTANIPSITVHKRVTYFSGVPTPWLHPTLGLLA